MSNPLSPITKKTSRGSILPGVSFAKNVVDSGISRSTSFINKGLRLDLKRSKEEEPEAPSENLEELTEDQIRERMMAEVSQASISVQQSKEEEARKKREEERQRVAAELASREAAVAAEKTVEKLPMGNLPEGRYFIRCKHNNMYLHRNKNGVVVIDKFRAIKRQMWFFRLDGVILSLEDNKPLDLLPNNSDKDRVWWHVDAKKDVNPEFTEPLHSTQRWVFENFNFQNVWCNWYDKQRGYQYQRVGDVCNEGKTAKSKVLIYDRKDSLGRPLNQEFEIIPIDFLEPKRLNDFLTNPNVGHQTKKNSALNMIAQAANDDSDDDNAIGVQ